MKYILMKKDKLIDGTEPLRELIVDLEVRTKVFKPLIRIEISCVKNYILSNEKTLIQFQDELNSKVEKQANQFPGNTDYELVFLRFQFKHFYPEMFYNSTLIWLYSFLENNLKKICDFLEKLTKFEIKVKDFGRQGIDRYEKYLRLVVGIASSDLKSSWSKIQKFGAVRDLMVHNGSIAKRDKTKPVQDESFYKFLLSNKLLAVDEGNGRIEIKDKKYLLEFAEEIQVYLIGILDLLDVKQDEIPM